MNVYVLEITQGGYDGPGIATTATGPFVYSDFEEAQRAARSGDTSYNRSHVGWQHTEVRKRVFK